MGEPALAVLTVDGDLELPLFLDRCLGVCGVWLDPRRDVSLAPQDGPLERLFLSNPGSQRPCCVKLKSRLVCREKYQ